MAYTHDTARPCPLDRNDPISESPSPAVDVPLHPAGAEHDPWFNVEYQRAITKLVVAVLKGILKEHYKCKDTSICAKREGLLPLNPVQRMGLENAIELLHHYVDTLPPPEGG